MNNRNDQVDDDDECGPSTGALVGGGVAGITLRAQGGNTPWAVPSAPVPYEQQVSALVASTSQTAGQKHPQPQLPVTGRFAFGGFTLQQIPVIHLQEADDGGWGDDNKGGSSVLVSDRSVNQTG